MQNEKRYPIYRFELEYIVEHPTKYWDEIGRNTESLAVDIMPSAPMTTEELEDKLRSIWLSNLISDRGGLPTLADQGAKLVSWTVSLLRYDAWVLTWFSHYTRNTHLSDEELLESFRVFVDGKREAQFNLEILRGSREEGKEYYCLMGAEDRWRWKGPCRCEHCQEQGIVRIDH